MSGTKLSEISINVHLNWEHAAYMQMEENHVAVMKSLKWNYKFIVRRTQLTVAKLELCD